MEQFPPTEEETVSAPSQTTYAYCDVIIVKTFRPDGRRYNVTFGSQPLPTRCGADLRPANAGFQLTLDSECPFGSSRRVFRCVRLMPFGRRGGRALIVTASTSLPLPFSDDESGELCAVFPEVDALSFYLFPAADRQASVSLKARRPG
jgi:hypothetical protein